MAKLLGNDVVDWSLLKTGLKAQNTRYLAKICSSTEIEQIQAAKRAEYALWRIWTIKEACYKAITQEHSFRAYIPKKIEVTLLNEQDAKVFSEWGAFYAKSNANHQYIHSIAYPEEEMVEDIYFQVFDGIEGGNPRKQVRTALLEDFSENYHRPIRALSIKKEGELPYIYEKGVRLKYRLSISYDGAFGAFAIRPIS